MPPDEYLVTDPEQEKNFGFSLREALSRARERRLLEGYEILELARTGIAGLSRGVDKVIYLN